MRLLCVVGLVALAGCSTTRVFVAPELAIAPEDSVANAAEAVPAVSYRVLLVGDAGEPLTDGTDQMVQLVSRLAEAAGEESAVVFLGDNVYPDGLPPDGDPGRADAEARLGAWLQAVETFPGRTLFVPGNHDWRDARAGGLDQVRRQEQFVESRLGPGTFAPSAGFPGPITVDLTDDLRLLAVDTEWWLAQFARGEGEDAEVESFFGEDDDFLLALADAVERAEDRRLLVVGHHPIVSNGDHAGYVPAERHLFPFAGKGALGYVPMPFVGSLVIALKRFQGDTPEDIAHPRYAALAEAMWEALADTDGLVYAAAHDHSLQYFALENGRSTIHQLISGAGSASKIEYVLPRDALFAASRPGLMVLTYYEDGSAHLAAITPAEGRPLGDTLLAAWILEPEPAIAPPPEGGYGAPPDLPPTVTTPVAPNYARASLLAAPILGQGYRQTWATPVTVPVLDVGRMGGGLTPERHAGSRQSLSARMAGADGRTYVLRSIEKDLPRPLDRGPSSSGRGDGQGTRGALYPFASMVAARLSDAAGLYHTDPRIVYVPDDPRLGGLRETFHDRVMTLEEHPADGPAGRRHFGNAREIVGTTALLRALDRDPASHVDAEFYLRARLFDMLIGDFDRHRDQWRWAIHDAGADGSGTVYRPIARDRDYAFHDPNGLLQPLVARFDPRLQGFDAGIGSVGALTESAREMDRRLLASLDRDTWLRVARDLQASLTDAEIASALDVIPEEARALDGERLRTRLMGRRDGLESAAARYFDMLNRVADVVGSHAAETFDVERTDDGTLHVSVGSVSSSWSRAYAPAETREVRIWGRGGDDRIEIRGAGAPTDIGLRILPGAGADVLRDETDGRRVHVYEGEDEEGLVVESVTGTTHVDRTNRVPQSAFGYAPPRHTTRRPLVTLSYDAADGLLVGVGVEITNPGFGRETFLRRHRIQAAVATSSLGGYVRYRGSYPEAVNRLDLGLDLSAQSALSSRNFFGFGSQSILLPDAPVEFYRVPLTEVRVAPYLERQVRGGVRGWAGPTLTYVRPDVDSTSFLATAGLPARDLEAQVFAGFEAGVEISAVDEATRPTNGARFSGTIRARQGALESDHGYAGLSTTLALYSTPPAFPWATLALRAGGERLFGTFPFYDAATIGGPSTLRGFRSGRFAGHAAVHYGLEPRVRLHRFATPIAPAGEVGALAFHDGGRVWSEDRDSSWHAGYGGGLWLSLVGRLTATATYDASSEGGSVSFRLGFAL